MKKLALSKDKVYLYPVMSTKEGSVHYKMEYGGEKCEAVPCGFEIELVIHKKLTRKQKKNRNYRKNIATKALTKLGRGLGVSNDKG